MVAGVLAAVALGQEVVPIQMSATVKVTSDIAGTPSHPRGVRIDARGTIVAAGDVAPPMPQSVDVWLPKDWGYNGASYPACARSTLVSRGPGACPPASGDVPRELPSRRLGRDDRMSA